MSGAYQVVCDSIVADPLGGIKIVEAMHSSVFNLSDDYGEIAARIHPLKRALFDAILNGAEVEVQVRDGNGELHSVPINRDIEIHVNRWGDGMAEVFHTHVTGKEAVSVRGEAQARGFDESSEPVLRQMQDRSFRLVFCTMPPRKHVLGERFDMDAFAEALINGVQAILVWDDRDVFHIPSATEEEIREILMFLYRYGRDV